MSTIRVKVTKSEGGGMFSSGGNEGVDVRIETMDHGLSTEQFSENVAALTVAADTLIRSIREADEFDGPVEGEGDEVEEAEHAPVSASEIADQAAAEEMRKRAQAAIRETLTVQDLVVISSDEIVNALVSGIYSALVAEGVLR